MKKPLTLFAVLFFSILGIFGQSEEEIKKIEKGIKQLGLSTIYLNEINLVVSQKETSVGDWLGFVENKRQAMLKNSNSDVLDSANYEILMSYLEFLNNVDIQNKIVWNKIFSYYQLAVTEKSMYGASCNYGETVGLFDLDYFSSEFIEIETYYSNSNIYIPFALNYSELESNYEDNQKLVKDSIKYFMDFPIYGIPYEQALEIAKWYGEIHNANKFNKSKLQFKGRLMTEKEYETLLQTAGPKMKENLSSYPDSINSLGCLLMNIIPSEKCKSTETKINLYGEKPIAVPVWSYNPDKYGLFNIYGNMAEMTMTKGVAKGGSFNNYAKDTFYDKSQSYPIDNDSNLPNWLGFRIVYEVKLD